MAKQEYEGVAFTAMVHAEDGELINATERAESSLDAYKNLRATIAEMKKDGFVPFVSYYNKAEGQAVTEPAGVPTTKPVSVVQTAKDLGGTVTDSFPITPEESASIASGVEKGRLSPAEAMGLVPEGLVGREVPEGHIYLGVKPGMLEDIRENDSYQVLAETYSWDGKMFVNFYNGSSNASVAGFYYANQTGQKIFQEMFHWTPAVVEKSPIPGGNVLLYMLGVNSKGTVYQNIKAVEPA